MKEITLTLISGQYNLSKDKLWGISLRDDSGRLGYLVPEDRLSFLKEGNNLLLVWDNNKLLVNFGRGYTIKLFGTASFSDSQTFLANFADNYKNLVERPVIGEIWFVMNDLAQTSPTSTLIRNDLRPANFKLDSKDIPSGDFLLTLEQTYGDHNYFDDLLKAVPLSAFQPDPDNLPNVTDYVVFITDKVNIAGYSLALISPLAWGKTNNVLIKFLIIP